MGGTKSWPVTLNGRLLIRDDKPLTAGDLVAGQVVKVVIATGEVIPVTRKPVREKDWEKRNERSRRR